MQIKFPGRCYAKSTPPTWFTVVPMLPCSSIWRILGSFDLIAESSFATWVTSLLLSFQCSQATSIAVAVHICSTGSPSSVCPQLPPLLGSRWSAFDGPPLRNNKQQVKMLISCNVLDPNIQFINLYSGFNVGEVVDSGENGFPLVLLCKLPMG